MFSSSVNQLGWKFELVLAISKSFSRYSSFIFRCFTYYYSMLKRENIYQVKVNINYSSLIYLYWAAKWQITHLKGFDPWLKSTVCYRTFFSYKKYDALTTIRKNILGDKIELFLIVLIWIMLYAIAASTGHLLNWEEVHQNVLEL